MKNRFIYIALALSIIILVWLGRIYIHQHKLQIQYTKDVEHTYIVIIGLRNCEQLLVDAESSQRGYLLTHVEHFLTMYYESIAKTDSVLARLTRTVADNPSQRVNIKLLTPAIKERISMLKENIGLKGDEKDFVENLVKGRLLMDKIRLYVAMMEKEEYALLQYRNTEKNRYQELNFSFLKYAFTFACLICAASILLIIRELRIRIRSQKMLEQSVFELKQSNEEIEQVSFAASHDLQEPLRKIRTLSTLLTKKYGVSLPPEEKDILLRIDRSTEHMHGLLENLIDFTNLISRPEKIMYVNLDSLFTKTFSKIMPGADIHLQKTTELPIIKGYEQQLSLLFTQLLSNSLLYRHTDRKSAVEVSYELKEFVKKSRFWQNNPVQLCHVITIKDNGIGFDNAFNEKIFMLFQRLHSHNEYSGKGIGLTIARRVMTNHYGYIEARGEKGNGATFTLYFPAV